MTTSTPPTEHADHLLLLLMETGIEDHVKEAHPTLWAARFDLTQNIDPAVQRLGYVLGLTAILQTPDALRVATEELRARLSEGLSLVW